MDEIQLCLILSLIPLARIDPCCPGGQSGQVRVLIGCSGGFALLLPDKKLQKEAPAKGRGFITTLGSVTLFPPRELFVLTSSRCQDKTPSGRRRGHPEVCLSAATNSLRESQFHPQVEREKLRGHLAKKDPFGLQARQGMDLLALLICVGEDLQVIQGDIGSNLVAVSEQKARQVQSLAVVRDCASVFVRWTSCAENKT